MNELQAFKDIERELKVVKQLYRELSVLTPDAIERVVNYALDKLREEHREQVAEDEFFKATPGTTV